jgi:hypothetical protein
LSLVRAKSTNAAAAPSVPPPEPNETILKSEGLNPQLHPTGKSPLSPASRASSSATAASSTEASPSPIESSSHGGIGGSPTGGYRTPLRIAPSNNTIAARDTVKVVYEGPLRKAVRGLKAFSISSLILSASMTPFILTMEANLPMVARVSLVTAGNAIFYTSNAALGASVLSTGIIHYFLSPYVIRATYMSLSHQLNLETYSIFARKKNNIVNVDDLRRIEGEGLRIIVNVKNGRDGKVWYVHPEPELAAKFWETLDMPRGGYKNMTGKAVRYKEKIGDDPNAAVFEQPS